MKASVLLMLNFLLRNTVSGQKIYEYKIQAYNYIFNNLPCSTYYIIIIINKTESQQFITKIINPIKSEIKSLDTFILHPDGQIIPYPLLIKQV